MHLKLLIYFLHQNFRLEQLFYNLNEINQTAQLRQIIDKRRHLFILFYEFTHLFNIFDRFKAKLHGQSHFIFIPSSRIQYIFISDKVKGASNEFQDAPVLFFPSFLPPRRRWALFPG